MINLFFLGKKKPAIKLALEFKRSTHNKLKQLNYNTSIALRSANAFSRRATIES